MTVIFRSDGNVSGRGFHATYRTIKGNIATRTEYLYVKMRCIYAACISKLAVWFLPGCKGNVNSVSSANNSPEM